MIIITKNEQPKIRKWIIQKKNYCITGKEKKKIYKKTINECQQ